MTTVQIVGIAIAAVVVLILVVVLVLTRHRGEAQDAPATAAPHRGSFLDDAPQDSFAGLGKAEQPVEDVTVDPAVEREARRAEEASRTVAAQARPAPSDVPEHPAPANVPPQHARGGLGLDWGPSGSDLGHIAPAAGAADSHPGEPGAAGEMPAAPPPVKAPAQTTPSPESGGHASPESARPAEGGSVAPEAAPESDAGGRMVPLSSIIVTTSRKMVDVQDPEVRRMLTDLVKFEIDQATQFRRDGQTIDAVLQLTEAEKISRALGMEDAARHIHQMLQEIQAG